MPSVILTNEKGESLGLAENIDAHTGTGMLHRAFSVYIFRSRGEELLLQHRAEGKRLFAGLWTNTCCSHVTVPENRNVPRGPEGALRGCQNTDQVASDIVATAERRLHEEMGFSCPLHTVRSFVYRAEDPKGHGIEHEYDTVLVGCVDDADVLPNPAEVDDWKWIHIDDLTEELEKKPDLFTPWFAQGLSLAKNFLAIHV